MEAILEFISASVLIKKMSASKPDSMLCRKIIVILHLALRFRFSAINQIIRQVRINRISSSRDLVCSTLIPIELLVVCSNEDLGMLPYCLRYAVLSSKNPIQSISVIIPDSSIEEAKRITKEYEKSISTRINFIGEEQYMGKEIIDTVASNFPRRKGWILQQLLKFSFSLESKSRGVLIIDADTLLLKPITWLDENDRQVLFLSSELHREYFIFLSRIGVDSPRPLISNVTHHQLVQPNLLRMYCQEIEVRKIEDMIGLILRFANRESLSAISIDYELYGQCIRSLNPNLVLVKKFANVGLKRDDKNLTLMQDMRMTSEFRAYDSVSLHSYIGVKF